MAGCVMWRLFAAAHLMLAGVWLGATTYSLLVVQPKVTRFFADPGRREEFLTVLAAGNRRSVVALISALVGYRTHRYRDRSNPDLHYHDARLSFSREGPPRIELMEVTGSGTHGPSELGVHHLGFAGVSDPEGKMAELARHGIGDDGCSLNEDGRLLLWFTDKNALDGVRLEFISPLPGPLVADNGRPLPRDPVTGRADIWAPPL